MPPWARGSPRLYAAVADCIHARGGGLLGESEPQGLSNLIWAYATAGAYHPGLFDMVPDRVTSLIAVDSGDGDGNIDVDPAPLLGGATTSSTPATGRLGGGLLGASTTRTL